MNELRRLLRYAAPYRGRLIVAFVAMVVYAAGSIRIAYLFKPIFDKQFASDDIDLMRIARWVLIAYVVKGIGGYVSSYLMTDVGQRVVKDIRNKLFGHILNQSAAFFSGRTSGQLISRITNDVNQVQMAVSETLADLVQESLTLAGYIIFIFYLDWRLALVCMTSAPLVVYPLARLGQKIRRATKNSQQDLEQVTHLSAEAFNGHRIVKAFGAEAREAERFDRASWRLFRTNMRITSAVSALPPIMEFIGGLAMVGTLWYGAGAVASGRLTVGELIAFIAAAFLMYTPVKKLGRINAGVQQTIAASQRIFETLDTHSEVHDKPGAPPIGRLTSGVEFKDVAFAYADSPDKYVLRDASFTVKAGQVLALVGLSGAGKTTLVNLLPRFFDVTHGKILIDGVDIRDVTLRSLRQQIALVTQETVLFDDTVAANIAYGRPDATRAEIEDAARAAHAHEFIVDLANGYDARIGERGQRLSGGQRQRLAIARAILKDCQLLILDEATSSLDAESELLVQKALSNLMRNRTTFVIAHRLSTIRSADMIIALEHGEIAEMGSHDSLVARPDGVYAKLYALQMFDDGQRRRVTDVGAPRAREVTS